MSTGFDAATVLALIAATGATIWLISAYFLANSPAMAARRTRDEPGKVDPESGLMAGPTTIVGEIVVEADPADATARVASHLARSGLLPGSALEIVDRTTDRVAFVSPGEPDKPRGEIRVVPAGPGRSRIAYTIEYAALRRYLRGGWSIQAAGLVVLTVLYGVMRYFVLTSPVPTVRFQSIQMAQCIHILWPPFLVGHLYRTQYRLVRRQVDTLIKNLPYTGP